MDIIGRSCVSITFGLFSHSHPFSVLHLFFSYLKIQFFWILFTAHSNLKSDQVVKREICAVITKGIYWQIKDFLKIWLFTLPSNCYSLPSKVLMRIWHGSTSQLLPVTDQFENSHYLFAGLFTDIIGRSFILRSLVEVKS